MKGIFLQIAGCSALGLISLGIPSGVLGAEGEAIPAEKAADPYISGLDISEDGRSVLVTLALTAELGELNRQALDGGIPFSYRYRLRLSRRGGGLLGEKQLADREIVHTLRYDPLRKVFRFTAEGYPEKVERETAERAEALSWMDRVDRIPLYPLDSLSPGKRYRVRAMATLRSAELPSLLGYLFFFTTLLNQDTAWKETDFTWR